jgi:hypothetical protein
MGTKTNPGKYDCLSKAEPDEPVFVLMARDPVAPKLVDLWAAVSYGSKAAARAFFDDLLKFADEIEPLQPADKCNEAYECAKEMEAWADARPTPLAGGDGAHAAANDNQKSASTGTPNAGPAAES